MNTMHEITSDQKQEIVIGAVGDISFQGKSADNPDPGIFSEVSHYLTSCDIGMANLENPLTMSDNKVPGKCTLRGDPGWATVLKESGINLVSLANNHIMDYGPDGLYDTICTLNSAHIKHVGAGKNKDEACAPLFLHLKGRTLAFLARSSVIVSSPSYAGQDTPGVAFLDSAELIASVRQCKEKADLVMIILHWGLEEYAYPSPSQVDLAQKLIIAGADAIIGHHPHVLQGMQHMGKGVIAYSLGNFLFDEFSWNQDGDGKEIRLTLSESNRRGMILQLSWDNNNQFESSKVFTRVDSESRIIVDASEEREMEFKTLSSGIDKTLYDYWWRWYALQREWDLRLKHTFRLSRIIKNIFKIRPRHMAELFKALKKSSNIAAGKSTNPYE